jgi:RNA polymerase-interacting CarD/CdnL/TRCF family regulator
VCRVIRDLCFYNSKKKLNDNDAMILERARKFLLDEWKIAFRISSVDAQRELDRLLDEGRQKAIQ